MDALLTEISHRFGTPCFVYFMDEIVERAARLRDAFDGFFKLSYAIKANPNAALLARMKSIVDYLDISSAGELRLARTAGWQRERLGFTGPGKRLHELQEAVANRVGVVVLESLDEAQCLDEQAASGDTRVQVAVRISPQRVPHGFGVNLAGKPTPFGIDEEDLEEALTEILALKHLDVVGFHIYSGSQCLQPESIAENYEIYVDTFLRFSSSHGIRPRLLIFGSGLGIPYYDDEGPLDLAQIADRIRPSLKKLRENAKTADAECVLETGRYLVGEAGIYLTRVINRKDSRGAVICICDGGMNQHLGACGHLGSVIHRNYRMFKVNGSEKKATTCPHELVGPFCTAIDTLGHAVELPELQVGDVVAVQSSGAYGVTASPIHFIHHDPPKEILVEANGLNTDVIEVSEFAQPQVDFY